MPTGKRRCLYCFTALPAGRADMRFCDDAHRKAHDRRATRAGETYSEGLRLLYLASDTATGVGRTLRKHVGPIAQTAADVEFPDADDVLRRSLAQARKSLGFVLDYLRWAEDAFLSAELSEEARADLAATLASLLIDDPNEEEE